MVRVQESLPGGKPPDLGCKVRLKHPDHVCFLVRKNAPEEEEGSDDEEDEEDEEDEGESAEEEGEMKRLGEHYLQEYQFPHYYYFFFFSLYVQTF